MLSRKRPSWIAGALALAVVTACGGLMNDDAPSPRAAAAVTVSPSTAVAGSEVTVRATGFSSDNTIVIGFGPPESEYEVVRQVSTDSEGSASVRVQVPTWATAGRDYVWVAADRDNEPKAISNRFRVTDR